MQQEHSVHLVPEPERDASVGLRVVAAGRIRSALHRHRSHRLRWHTISLCLQGGGRRAAGRWSYNAAPPYVTYLPAGQAYDFTSAGSRYEAIWINLAGDCVVQILRDAGLRAGGGCLPLSDAAPVRARFRSILDLVQRRPQHYTELAAADCYALCMQLRMRTRPVDPIHHELLRSLEESGGVEVAAARVGCSRQTYIRRFKASFGMTPWQHVLRQRIERACELLSDPDLPVADVGAAVGFPDPGHFARVFKRLRGCTPGRWRDG